MKPDEPDARHERGIDTIDRRILRVLQADGRISKLKLAKAVHLSPTALLERVKRLTRENHILGHEARLNPLKLGAGLLVFVEILLNRTHAVMEEVKSTGLLPLQTLPVAEPASALLSASQCSLARCCSSALASSAVSGVPRW